MRSGTGYHAVWADDRMETETITIYYGFAPK